MNGCRGIVSLVMAVSLSLIFSGCAASGPKEPVQTPDYSRVKGYTIKLGELKAGSFETPVYIPKKIRFELELELRQKQLLASEGDKKTLTVNILSSTYYIGYFTGVRASAYRELTSVVEVVDTTVPEIVAKTKVYGYNVLGVQTSDFTERDHAKQIAEFLERIVR